MAASIGCAIHCAAMPFVIAYLPALGLSFLADEAFHKWMAVACFVIALTAFIPGLRKHRRLTPMIAASAGLVMISVAAFGFEGECCPSCEAAATEVAAAGRAATTGRLASESTAVCTDEGCQLCASEGPLTSTTSPGRDSTSLAAATPLWVERIAPWLTPLGGIVLVSAHLLNRRYGCLCGCCDRETTEGATR
ncbi:MAG: MerC domain-containing protein [Planctomycetota bacterium]